MASAQGHGAPKLFAEKNEVDLSIELINGGRIELKAGTDTTVSGATASAMSSWTKRHIPRTAGRWLFDLRGRSERRCNLYLRRGVQSLPEWYEQAETEPDWETFAYNTIEVATSRRRRSSWPGGRWMSAPSGKSSKPRSRASLAWSSLVQRREHQRG